MNKDHLEAEEAEKTRAGGVKATTSQSVEESKHVIQVAKQRIAEAIQMILSTRRRVKQGEVTQKISGPPK